MDTLLTMLEPLGFLNLLWLLVLAFVLHEVEEWRIADFEHRNFGGIPPYATDRSAHVWIGFICVVAVIWCMAATLPGNPSVAAWVFLPALAVVLANALQHVYWTLRFRQYAPGLVTAVLLLIPMGGCAVAWATLQGYAPAWYVAICMGLIAVELIETVKAGDRMTRFVQGVYRIGYTVSEKWFRSAG